MAANIIRRFVIKQLSKDRGSGIMEIPNRFTVDQRQLSLQNYLIKKGIDPNSIKSEGQLNTILQQLEKNRIATGLKKAEAQKKMAEIMDMKGRKIKNPENIMGGEEVGMFDNIFARMKKDMDKGRFKTVKKKETEKEIAERIKRENKEAIDRIKKDKDFDFDQDPEFASGGRAGLSYLLAEDGNERMPLAEGSKAPDEIEEREYEGPYYETDKAEEALKELARRYIEMKVAPAKVPISDSIQLMFDLNRMKIGGSKDFLGGEIDFGYNKNFGREGESYGIGYRKSFAAGGGVNRLRRLFLKMLGAGAATTAALKSGLISLGGKKSAAKQITKEIIKTDNVAGKPEWFDALVTRVIKEGDDVSKNFATKERQIIHKKKITEDESVTVTQDLDEGSITVDYDSPSNTFEETVTMKYKKPLPDEGDPRPTAEFEVAESGPVGRSDGPDDYTIEIDEVGGSSIKDLDSDVSKLKEFATKKKPTIKEMMQNKKRKDKAKAITEDSQAQSDAVVARQGEVDDSYYGDPDELAEGGRAKMYLGGGLLQGKSFLRKMLKNLAKDRDQKASFMMRVMNPKSYQKALESAKGSGMYDRRTGILQSDKIKNVIEEAKESRLKQLEAYKEMAETSREKAKNLRDLKKAAKEAGVEDEIAESMANSLDQMFDGPIPKGATDETILELEQMIKNMTLRNTNRLTNAKGGVARLLGE